VFPIAISLPIFFSDGLCSLLADVDQTETLKRAKAAHETKFRLHGSEHRSGLRRSKRTPH
jgi:hypothetical protein